MAHRCIELVDSDTGERFDCELHVAEKKYCVERYIGHGWYEFMRNKHLKRGEKLAFILRDPLAKRLVVTVLNR